MRRLLVSLTAICLLPLAAQAQEVVDADHLKCYQVVRDESPMKTAKVDLFVPQLNTWEKDCTVQTTKPLLCMPAAKCIFVGNTGGTGEVRCDDPMLQGPIPLDFTCYKLRCPDAVEADLLLFDQFSDPNGRRVRIKNEKMLCAPAKKLLYPADGDPLPLPSPSE